MKCVVVPKPSVSCLSSMLRTKFFSLDDDLREVAKVSEMNDALLDEMKVRNAHHCLRLIFNFYRI